MILIVSITPLLWEYLQTTSLFTRLNRLSEGDYGERVYTYSQAFYHLRFNWYEGLGFSNSGNIIYNNPRYYPHNFHLHYLTDSGFIGVLFSILWMLGVFIIACNNYFFKKSKDSSLALMLFLYIYMNYFKSFSIFEAWWLAIASGIVLSISSQRKVIN